MAQNLSKTTTDHETIRRWAEERGGKPSEVIGTASEDETGMIRIDFPGYSGAGQLREISWDEWFEKFDASNLALVYEDETSGGERSSFNKLIGRETAQARAEGVPTSRRRPGGRRAGSTGARRGTAVRSRSRAAKRGGGTSRRTSRRGTGRSAGSRRGTQQGRRSASRRETARTTTGRRTGTGKSRSSSRSKSRSRSGSRSRSTRRSR